MHKDTTLYSLLQLTDFQGKYILRVTSLILQYYIRVIVFVWILVSSKYISPVTGVVCFNGQWTHEESRPDHSSEGLVGISSIIDQVIEGEMLTLIWNKMNMEPIQGERNEDKYGKRNGKGDLKNTEKFIDYQLMKW